MYLLILKIIFAIRFESQLTKIFASGLSLNIRFFEVPCFMFEKIKITTELAAMHIRFLLDRAQRKMLSRHFRTWWRCTVTVKHTKHVKHSAAEVEKYVAAKRKRGRGRRHRRRHNHHHEQEEEKETSPKNIRDAIRRLSYTVKDLKQDVELKNVEIDTDAVEKEEMESKHVEVDTDTSEDEVLENDVKVVESKNEKREVETSDESKTKDRKESLKFSPPHVPPPTLPDLPPPMAPEFSFNESLAEMKTLSDEEKEAESTSNDNEETHSPFATLDSLGSIIPTAPSTDFDGNETVFPHESSFNGVIPPPPRPPQKVLDGKPLVLDGKAGRRTTKFRERMKKLDHALRYE